MAVRGAVCTVLHASLLLWLKNMLLCGLRGDTEVLPAGVYSFKRVAAPLVLSDVCITRTAGAHPITCHGTFITRGVQLGAGSQHFYTGKI